MNFPEEWTGDVIKRMHLHDISQNDLSGPMGVSREIICKTLNGKYDLKNGKERFNAAIDFILANRK